jgi:hypothetical protein
MRVSVKVDGRDKPSGVRFGYWKELSQPAGERLLPPAGWTISRRDDGIRCTPACGVEPFASAVGIGDPSSDSQVHAHALQNQTACTTVAAKESTRFRTKARRT